MYRRLLPAGFFLLIAAACGNNANQYDASGSFEADEVIVSSEIAGKILALRIDEGSVLGKDSLVGTIDATNVSLQKEQVEASISALREKTVDAGPQVRLLQEQLNVQESQMASLVKEQQRVASLLKADAATTKQLDDINAQIDILKNQMDVTRQQIRVQLNNISTQNRSIMSEENPLKKRVDQLQDQLDKAGIRNPVNGTVITKYAEAGEITSPGKALYKIADLSEIYLRAYVTGNQLPLIRLNQPVKVMVDSSGGKYRHYNGTISWISDKAEFTPKTIQTKEERANLVYAIKIKVANDGFLKIGMYGEVKF